MTDNSLQLGQNPRSSLRYRLVAGALFASVIAIWAFTYLVGRYQREEMQAAISAQQFSTVSVVAAEIERSVKERELFLSVLASRMVEMKTADYQLVLEAQAAMTPMFNWGMFVLDAEGNAIASVPKKLERQGTHYGDLPIFMQTREARGVSISAPLRGRKTGVPIIAMTYPLRSADGRFMGALFGVTNLQAPNFLDQIGLGKFGKTGDFLVTDAKTRIFIASSDKNRVMRAGPQAGVNPVYDAYLNGREGSGVAVSSRGVEELSSSVRIGQTGWLMQSVLPTRDAFHAIEEMQTRLLIYSLLLTALAGLIAWVWVRNQLRPLEQAAEMLDGMRQGLLPRGPLPVVKQDEIGSLATAFNALLVSIVEQEAWQTKLAATERVRKILAHVPGMVFQYYQHWDGTGAFPFASEAVKTLYGVSSETIENDATIIRNLLLPEDRERFFQSLAESAQGMKPWLIDYRIRTPDGVFKWLRIDAVPERDEVHGIVWYGFVTDVSEHKALEDELLDYRNRLEELVKERTEQLEEARDAAQSANIAKSAFLANMSHEIRTPLNAISGMAYLLSRDALTPAQSDRLSKIKAASQHLLEIINAVLDLSKIEAGKLALELRPLRVGSVLNAVQSIMDERAKAKGLSLQIDPDYPQMAFVGDITRIQQALFNYVANAIKFTDSGQVLMRCLLLEEAADKAVLRFEVIDSGIGIAADVLPRLFNSFQQADNTTTRKYGGTGLGLAITRKLAELMGGTAGAESQLGVGSRFWFEVSLPKAPARTNEFGLDRQADAEILLRLQHSGKKVLIVEDEAINREIAASLLSEAGLEVDCAEDGWQALERCQAAHYDLILMDMQMPRMDGLTATGRIRALGEAGQVPIVAMTANAFAEDKEKCRQAGMDDFVAKPFSAEEFYAIILKWLDRRPALASPAGPVL